MNRKGFTLIELILVIAILGILAVSALPKFLNLSTQAKDASRDGVVGAVRSGVALYRANDMVTRGGSGAYPTVLDANATGACVTCFSNILATGVNDSNWRKVNDTQYQYYNGTANMTFNVDTTNGTFQ